MFRLKSKFYSLYLNYIILRVNNVTSLIHYIMCYVLNKLHYIFWPKDTCYILNTLCYV